MRNSDLPLRQRGGARAAAGLSSVLVLVGFVLSLLVGPSAHASTGLTNRFAADRCTPPTNPYGSSTTIAECGTTTTVAQATITLTISYKSGVVDWRACVSERAEGSTVQLYINGSLEDSSQITSDRCTPKKDLALCLRPGSYNATAVDQPYGQGSAVLRVDESGCSNPAVLAATAAVNGSGGTATGHSGGLAFTGADIALMVIAAAALITIGIVIVKMTRQRQSAR